MTEILAVLLRPVSEKLQQICWRLTEYFMAWDRLAREVAIVSDSTANGLFSGLRLGLPAQWLQCCFSLFHRRMGSQEEISLTKSHG